MIAGDQSHVRLRAQIARNWIGKDRAHVAADMGVAAGTYGNFELGKQSLPAERFPALAESLCVPVEFLTHGPIDWMAPAKLSYRRRAAVKSAELKHVQSVASMASEFARLIESYVSAPPMTVPLLVPRSPDEIEDLARDLRSGLEMSDAPLRHALDLVESMGVFVFWVRGDRLFDGVSFWVGSRPFMLLNSNQGDAYRARFTVLHELGHLVMHRSPDDVGLLEEERSRMDCEANDFASAFLLPARSFARRFPRYGSLNQILEERRYWMASCAAMVRRARQLKLITEDHYRRLCVSISSRGWRLAEPNTPTPEQSRVHGYFFDEAGEHGLTPVKLAGVIACPVSWIQEGFPQAARYSSLEPAPAPGP